MSIAIMNQLLNVIEHGDKSIIIDAYMLIRTDFVVLMSSAIFACVIPFSMSFSFVLITNKHITIARIKFFLHISHHSPHT